MLTVHLISLLTSFLVSSYGVALVLVAIAALLDGVVDLCGLVKMLIISPIITFIAGALLCGGIGLIIIIFQNILFVLKIILFFVTAVSVFALVSNYVIAPSVKKVVGITKPFSENICVVLYRKK